MRVYYGRMIPFHRWKNDARCWVRNQASGPVCVVILTDNPKAAYMTNVREPRTGSREFIGYVDRTPGYEPLPSVYFLTSSTHIKVGCSIDVHARCRAIQSPATKLARPANGDTTNLAIFGILPDLGYSGESTAKKALRKHRDVGEWFHLSIEALAAIRAMPTFQELK